jgi:hypothetical protein
MQNIVVHKRPQQQNLLFAGSYVACHKEFKNKFRYRMRTRDWKFAAMSVCPCVLFQFPRVMRCGWNMHATLRLLFATLVLNLLCVFQPLASNALPALVSRSSLYRLPMVAGVEAHMLESQGQKILSKATVFYFPVKSQKNCNSICMR